MTTEVEEQIQTAIKDHLKAQDDCIEFAWENIDKKSIFPRLEVDFFITPFERLGINNGSGRYSGFVQLTVVWEKDVGTDAPNRMAGTIKSWFPSDLKLDLTNSALRITQSPSIKGGFPDETSWRVPVDVSFETLT